MWIGPAWAVVCGIVASGAFAWSGRDLMIAVLAIMLVDGAWATVWWGLVETDWSAALSRWSAISPGQPLRLLPFAQPASPAERTQRWLARFIAWWRSELWPRAGSPLSSVMVSLGLSMALSAVIGWPALALSLAALALTQAGLLARRMRGRAPSVAHGFLDVGLAWALGHAALGSLSLLSAGMAIIFSVSYAAALELTHSGRSNRAWLLAQMLAVIVLVVIQQPVAAFMLTAVLAAQAMLSTILHGLAFARAAQFWLMAAMLIAALAVRG